MMLEKGILTIRSQQSQATFLPWWRMPPWKRHKLSRTSYEVAQFLHQVPHLMANDEFTAGDLWFLNIHARSFFTRAEPKISFLYTHFLSPTRQLFSLVPEDMREQLEWPGPESPQLTLTQRADINQDLFETIEHNENIELLHHALAIGADLNARNSTGKTPLEVAKQLDRTEHVQVLREAGANE